jgi:hypothetical protein
VAERDFFPVNFARILPAISTGRLYGAAETSGLRNLISQFIGIGSVK